MRGKLAEGKVRRVKYKSGESDLRVQQEEVKAESNLSYIGKVISGEGGMEGGQG